MPRRRSAAPPPSYLPARMPPPRPVVSRGRQAWARITDGLALNQLWKQFQADAHSSYRLYSRDVAPAEPGERRKFLGIGGRFAWAVIEKLSPAKRVLLLVALFLLLINSDTAITGSGGGTIYYFNGAFWGGLLILFLLILEVADRVVMKRDLQIAKEIQSWLLPSAPPVIPGLEVAFATVPANTVAGDYYDVFASPSKRAAGPEFLIAIADVAGKSIPAAMLMATFQASLKTLAPSATSLPALVEGMNAYACANSQNGRRFTTAFLAEYEADTRRLTYVNAGHNNPILLRANGTIERLAIGGIPLGIMNRPYASDTVTLAPNDWLVIFTDGVTEAENRRTEEYGEFRLLTVLAANLAAHPSGLLRAIFLDLDRFVADAPQHDDITLLLLKAT
jgi:sigma-B regulation protein RsbU (phosphoserine phosphatase)